jgi:23S rRNA (uridine2552-2'-O)-methyltransferase
MANYDKPDFWALKAKKEGYPARSVYKLQELDEKFGLLKPERSGRGGIFRALDLGAAPGSWSLYILRKMGSGVFLAAADVSPLSRQYDRGLFGGENYFFVQGDITAAETRETLLSRGPYGLILSDAAPVTTGSRSVDVMRSLEIAGAVLDYAEAALEKGGSAAFKVFQGGGASEILKRLRSLFKTGKTFKPAACRRESFETYYLGLGFRGRPFSPGTPPGS